MVSGRLMALKSLVANPTVKVLFFAYTAQTSTTVLLKPIQHMVVSALKYGFYKGEVLPEAKQPAKKGRRWQVMLIPKRVKHRKQFRGRMKGRASAR